ncbi:hypothetical protein BSAF29S_02864 [Bacillus safensis subsp. safensis]
MSIFNEIKDEQLDILGEVGRLEQATQRLLLPTYWIARWLFLLSRFSRLKI